MPGKGYSIVSIVQMDSTGDSRYRMEWPARALAEKEPEWCVINLNAQAKERFTLSLDADLLLLVQSSDLDFLPIIDERKKLGKPTVVEYNDNFYAAPVWSPIAKAWSSPLLWDRYEKLMKAGDACIVTSKGLKDLFFRKTGVNSTVIHNALLSPPPNFHSLIDSKSTPVTIGWAGSLGHMADFLSLTPVLQDLSNEFQISVMGNESIPSLINIPSMNFTQWGSIEQYFSFWDPITMGIIPLKDTPYNRCRSDIKPIELLSRGVLPIISRSRTYEYIIDKLNLPSFRDIHELKERITYYANHPDERIALVAKGHEYVLNHRHEAVDHRRRDFYVSLLSQTSPSSLPFNPGYHDIVGTPYPTTRLEEQLRILPSEPNKVERLQQYIKRNPSVPEAHLLLVSLLRDNQSEFLDALLRASQAFPHDLRFDIALVEQSSPDRAGEIFEKMMKKLIGMESTACAFWQKPLLDLFLKTKNLHHLQALHQLYPANVKLLFALAEAFRMAGEFDAAHEFYDRLARLKQDEASLDGLQELDLGYLTALTEGTEWE